MRGKIIEVSKDSYSLIKEQAWTWTWTKNKIHISYIAFSRKRHPFYITTKRPAPGGVPVLVCGRKLQMCACRGGAATSCCYMRLCYSAASWTVEVMVLSAFGVGMSSSFSTTWTVVFMSPAAMLLPSTSTLHVISISCLSIVAFSNGKLNSTGADAF